MTDIKLCKDCKWHEKISEDFVKSTGEYICTHEYIDVVTGDSWDDLSCWSVRRDENLCGHKGKYFEPKEG